MEGEAMGVFELDPEGYRGCKDEALRLWDLSQEIGKPGPSDRGIARQILRRDRLQRLAA